MSAPISPISSVPAAVPDLASSGRTAPSRSEFGTLLENAISGVESIRRQSTATVERFLSGEGEDLHTTVLATQRAELSFQLFLQVRNKVVEAYQEIMRMQT